MIRVVGMLTAGNAIAQAVQLAAQPVLARMYSVSDFGGLGQLTSIAAILAVVGTLQMHTAMVLPREKRQAVELMSAGLFVAVVVFVAAVIGLVTLRAEIFGREAASGLPWMCALMLLAVCLSSVLKGWQTATGEFRTLSIFALLRAGAIVGLQFAFGALAVPSGLVVGAILAEFVGVIGVVVIRQTPPIAQVFAALSPRTVYRSLLAFKDFAIYGTIQELMSVVVFTMPVYWFTRQYSPSTGGQFAMGHRLVWAPVVLVASALTQVTYHHFASLSREELPGSPFLRADRRIVALMAATAVAVLLAPAAMLLLLGSKWALAADMSRWIVLWAGAFLLSVPFRVCFRVLRYQRAQLLIDSATAAVIVGAFLCAAWIPALRMTSVIAALGVLQNLALALVVMARLRTIDRTQEALS